jgi:gluconokinase
MIVVLMGVSGSGKTTVGEVLSRELAWPYLEGDDHHPAANVAKMRAGTPLTDADRWPWLDRLNALLRQRQAGGENLVWAARRSSGLSRSPRAGAREVRWVHLRGSFE